MVDWEDRAEFPPGPQLACALSGGLTGLTDIELAETIAAARRQTSWAQALELTAIAELSARRTAQAEAARGWWDSRTHRAVAGEVSLALTLTPSAASTLTDLAAQLTEQLPDTLAALRSGHIDLPRATVIADGVRGLPDPTVRLVEDTVLPQVTDLTTGQLRDKIKKIIQLIDPDGYEQRRRQARAGRRVEVYDTPTGTADLAVRDIATEVAHAIYNRLTAAATAMNSDGDARPIDAIRADLTCDLLRGTPLPDAVRTLITTPPDTTEHRDPGHDDALVRDALPAWEDTPGGHITHDGRHEPTGRAGHAGHAERAARDGQAGQDGDVHPRVGGGAAPGWGNDAQIGAGISAAVDRELAAVLARTRASGRLDQAGARIHQAAQSMADALTRLKGPWCAATQGQSMDGHGHQRYRPPASMRRFIEDRHPTCVFPSCNRRSVHCDLDHTKPYDQNGLTCVCNLAPLCRSHHQLKQHPQWKLLQLWPGLLLWITPSGQWHLTLPHPRR